MYAITPTFKIADKVTVKMADGSTPNGEVIGIRPGEMNVPLYTVRLDMYDVAAYGGRLSLTD